MDAENATEIDNTDLFLEKHEQIYINLGQMAAKIAFYNFQWLYIALILYIPGKYFYSVDTFLSHYNQTVVIKYGKFRPQHRATVPQFVLFGEEASEIIDYLQWLVEMKFDNTGKFLIICYSKDYEKCDEERIFKTLAANYITNVILLRAGDIEDEPVPFTYKVILPDKCKNNEPEKLDLKNDCPNDACFKLLYGEQLNNLHKCPLIVSTFEQPPFMYLHNGTEEPTGGDGDMLKVVTSGLNASLVIKTPVDGNEWGHYENNNWTGSMGDVFNDRAHLSVCSYPLTTSKYGNFQISFIYNTMDIVWVAKLPDVKPPWEKLLRPFNVHARLAVVVMFICVIIISGLLKTRLWRRIRKWHNIGYPKQSLFFYSWVIFLGVPILKVPTKLGPLITVYSWVWFCFVIRSCYQGALINSLKERVYQSKFESFQEILQNKHTYGGQGTYREYFVNEKHIYDNWKQLSYGDAYGMLEKISNGTSEFVLAFNKEIVIEHLLEHNGTRKLQMLPLKIVNSPTVMYMRKYSPIAASLNTILSRAVESGYASLWHTRFKRQGKHLFDHSESHGPEALSLEHFAGFIVVIVFGWLISILFFIIEVYCGRVEDDD